MTVIGDKIKYNIATAYQLSVPVTFPPSSVGARREHITKSEVFGLFCVI